VFGAFFFPSAKETMLPGTFRLCPILSHYQTFQRVTGCSHTLGSSASSEKCLSARWGSAVCAAPGKSGVGSGVGWFLIFMRRAALTCGRNLGKRRL
jgi:hypothetical protein